MKPDHLDLDALEHASTVAKTDSSTLRSKSVGAAHGRIAVRPETLDALIAAARERDAMKADTDYMREKWNDALEQTREFAQQVSALKSERDALKAKEELWTAIGQSHDALEEIAAARDAEIAALKAKLEEASKMIDWNAQLYNAQCNESAALRSRVERLEGALKPFADIGRAWNDANIPLESDGRSVSGILAIHFRGAHAALEETRA